jgi:hypothetical protein
MYICLVLVYKTFIPEEKHMLSERLSLYCLKFLFNITQITLAFEDDGPSIKSNGLLGRGMGAPGPKTIFWAILEAINLVI